MHATKEIKASARVLYSANIWAGVQSCSAASLSLSSNCSTDKSSRNLVSLCSLWGLVNLAKGLIGVTVCLRLGLFLPSWWGELLRDWDTYHFCDPLGDNDIHECSIACSRNLGSGCTTWITVPWKLLYWLPQNTASWLLRRSKLSALATVKTSRLGEFHTLFSLSSSAFSATNSSCKSKS